MTTLLDQSPETTTPAEQLRTTMAAMRLSFTWFGTLYDPFKAQF